MKIEKGVGELEKSMYASFFKKLRTHFLKDFILFLLSSLHAQCETQTQDPDIKSRTLFQNAPARYMPQRTHLSDINMKHIL